MRWHNGAMCSDITQIKHLLSHEDVDTVRSLLADAPFVEGALSAGDGARAQKNNLEAALPEKTREQVDKLVMGRLTAHPEYLRAALPVAAARPIYAKYTVGMAYGEHHDDPLMGEPPNRYRSDIAVTIFLSAPDAYDGGELVIHSDSPAPTTIKYAAGDAVLYPASTMHRIARVTRGERLVALTWVQSLIRDRTQRALLATLGGVRDSLAAQAPGSPERRRIEQVYSGLVRLWGEH